MERPQTPTPPFSEDSNVRLSSSPAGTPRLVQAPVSPVQSVHLDMMEDSIPPRAMKSGFEDSSDDGVDGISTIQAATPNGPKQERGRRRSSPPPRKEQSYLGGAFPSGYLTECQEDARMIQVRTSPLPGGIYMGPDGFLKLTSTPDPQNTALRPPPAPHNSASYEEEDSTPVATEARPFSVRASGPAKVVHHSSPRSSGVYEGIDETEPNNAAMVATIEATNEAIKDIHTQTMQALLRNEESLQANGARISFAPDTESRSTVKKRVSLVPPPLEITGASTWVPENIVRTPYPFLFRKMGAKPSPLRTSSSIDRARESILALSIRRHEATFTHPRRVTKITIPANLDEASKLAAASPGAKEKHFDTLDFDDAHFFNKLKETYHSLAGPFRFFSARTLQRIEVSHSVTCASEGYSTVFDQSLGSCPHEFPRSPRFLTSQDLIDSFSTSEIMKYYRAPGLGKARYAWVHWAHRISTLPVHLRSPAPVPPADSPAVRLAANKSASTVEEGKECAAGLEFVEGWCAWRILLAVFAVLVFALAASLCWVLFGINLTPMNSGYRDAGDRVAGGALLGLLVLGLGWTGVIGWVVLSWLVD